MDRTSANKIKKEIEDALSPFNPIVRYNKPQPSRCGYYEVEVDDYYSNADIISDALTGVCRKHSLFFDDDSDADFNLGASWDV